MTVIVDFLNSILWNYVLIYGLLAVGIYFTFRLGFPQFLHFPEMIRTATASRGKDAEGISPFQALAISLGSRVGTGNIVGVAVALHLGGPGAIFWMWIVAFVGMSSAYAESALAQLYKVHGPMGTYRGGPAFYISKGLGLPWLGVIFSLCLILSFGLVFNAVQSNAIADAMNQAFEIPPLATGFIISALAAAVIFGGIRQIARVAEIIVPAMALVYMALAIYVIVIDIDEVPGILYAIVAGAFGLDEAAGGAVGGMTAALLNGVKRGLFSNEAGMGSAPNIAASATPIPHHPSSQGFVQALAVFIDTIIVCTATAVVILLAGVYDPGVGPSGVELTQASLAEHIGPAGNIFIAIAILFFAFTSIIGNYSYAEGAMIFLGVQTTRGLLSLRLVLLAMVVWGSVQTVETVFNTADASMGLMATINLIAIMLLSGTVVKLTRDYFEQRSQGVAPAFHAADYPELADKVEHSIWYRDDEKS